MKVLIKNAQIIVPDNVQAYSQPQDVLIENGIISAIENNISTNSATVIKGNQLVVTNGFVDVFSHFNDPGQEHKESIESGAQAAFAGGYTQVFTIPNTIPVVNGKAQVSYGVSKSAQLPVNIWPIGAISKQIEGKELAEMYDMHMAGAKAFSDGLQPVQSAGLFLKALQYVRAIDATIIQMPFDKSIGANGLMNEGIISTQLGLPGMPAISELLMIQRDLQLLAYTNSKLHFSGVTTAEGIQLIREAKQKGLQVSCSITPYHLFFTDAALTNYDTNLKLLPPLRTDKDVEALKKALLDGTVDCIATHHLPQDWDSKTCEFEYAKWGMIGLQTAFSVISHLFPQLTAQQLANLFSFNARNIFGLTHTNVAVGNKADLVVFDRTESFTFTPKQNFSKSSNSAFFHQPLNGKIIACIHKHFFHFNQN
ncbi:MAG: dihydroorotase [Chitinophagaceae bacterium]